MDSNILKSLEEAYQMQILEEKTIVFWNLQLQFLELDKITLFKLFNGVVANALHNKQSLKIYRELPKLSSGIVCLASITEEQRQCIATNLAVILSGVEE